MESPDFASNNVFNSFGNLAVDPTAAPRFVEFETGRSLQLSGRATLQWSTGNDDTGRRVRFDVERVIARQLRR